MINNVFYLHIDCNYLLTCTYFCINFLFAYAHVTQAKKLTEGKSDTKNNIMSWRTAGVVTRLPKLPKVESAIFGRNEPQTYVSHFEP